MDKNEIVALANLLAAMKDVAVKLEHAIRKKDSEQISLAKKEILYFQVQIREIL